MACRFTCVACFLLFVGLQPIINPIHSPNWGVIPQPGERVMAAADVFKMIKENEVKFVDLRFTDTKGKEQHVTVPAKMFDEDKFTHGHAFDGSSIAGWKGIEASDMLLMPDPGSARMDPFMDEPTLN